MNINKQLSKIRPRVRVQNVNDHDSHIVSAASPHSLYCQSVARLFITNFLKHLGPTGLKVGTLFVI